MIFEINHRTAYNYSAPVSQSHHLLHLTPRTNTAQTVFHHSLSIDPAPASKTDLVDDFGNPVSIVTIEQDHTELHIDARSQVKVEAMPMEPGRTGSWNDVAAQLRANLGPETFDAVQYTCPSRCIRPSKELYKFARPSFPDGRPIIEAALDLTARINRDFGRHSGRADAAASIEEVLKTRRGICHDFAHLEIACLRTLGLAARYVSGYLLTKQSEDAKKLVGLDASHAWVAVWAPETGWVDLDPANNLVPYGDRITLAIGRDFQDVSPVSGVLIGGGDYEVEISVDVTPISSTPREAGSELAH